MAAEGHLSYRGAMSAIGSGRVARLYVIWGDSYLTGRVVVAIRRQLLDGAGDFDLDRFDGASAAAAEIGQAVRTVPFLGQRRVVIVERARLFRARGKQAAAASPSAAERDLPSEADEAAAGPADGAAPDAGELQSQWEGILGSLPPSTCLIMLPETAPDSRLRLTKLALKQGVLVDCGGSGREGAALAAEVVRDSVREMGIRADWRVQGLLLSTVGSDCGQLVGELAKLQLYCGSRAVTAEDVLLLCPRSAEADIWQLLDAVEADRPAEALRVLRASLARGESPVALVANLASQIRIMARSRERTQAGVAASALPGVLGANRFWVEQSLRRARLFSLTALYGALTELARLDLAIKTGATEPDLAVESFVLRLSAARRQPGERTIPGQLKPAAATGRRRGTQNGAEQNSAPQPPS